MLPLSFPELEAVPGAASQPQVLVGVSLEPLAEAQGKQGMKLAAKEEFCKRVGLDLFNYLQSFGGMPPQLSNLLDQWFLRSVAGRGGLGRGLGLAAHRMQLPLAGPLTAPLGWMRRLSNKLRRDPDFLTRTELGL